MSSLIEPTGAVHGYEWSAESRLMAYTDPLDAVTRYRYNIHGELVERLDANGHALRYTFDLAGRLIALTNENGEVARFAYDLANRMSDETGFDGRYQRYCYNIAGELTHLVEAGGTDLGPGKVTRFERDALGRLVVKSAEGELACRSQFRYDAVGRLTAAENAVASIAFAYDPIGQLLSETQTLAGAAPRALTHAYDPLGNRVLTTLPDRRKLHWLFYGSGHLHQVNLEKDGQHRVVSDFERDALHREIGRSQGALQSKYDYDPMGRLARHQVSRADGDLLVQSEGNFAVERAYRYDAAGNLILALDGMRGDQSYRYDPARRIVAATGRHDEMFSFDPAGNLLNGQNGLKPGQIYGNRMTVYQDLRFEYDGHGNMIRRRKGAHEEAVFRWNALHQLDQAAVTRKGVTQVTRYEYDALSRRTRKRDTFGATEYLWDGHLMIESRRGSKSALFVFEPHDFVPLATLQDDKMYWYQCSQIGAPLELTDADGCVAWVAEYQVWGQATLRKTGTGGARDTVHGGTVSAPLVQPFRFQGQQFDDETGMHYNRFRYYDPGVGRFISQDPIGLAGGSNEFAYVFSPFTSTDPLGLAPKKPSQFALQDGTGATPADIAASKVGGGNRKGQPACRDKHLKEHDTNNNGRYICWRCKHSSTNPADMHLGHKIVPTSKGGNLDDVNTDLEGASCNLSAGNSGYAKEGMSCVERGSCGAPYGR